MKKLFLIFILFLANPLNLNAKTFYTPYDIPYNSETQLKKDDVTKVTPRTLYQAYKLEYTKEYADKMEYEETGNIKFEKDGEIIDTKPNGDYQIVPKYQFINRTPYFSIYNEKIYTIIIDLIEIKNEQNEIVKTYENTLIGRNQTITMECNVPNATIKIHFSASYHYPTFNIKFNNQTLTSITKPYDNTLQEYVYSTKNIDKKIIIRDDLEDELFIKENTFDREVAYYQPVKIIKEYLVPHKEYLDLYLHEESEEYFVDLDKPKTFYEIQKRDKLEIKDRIIIEDYDFKFDDIVLNKTIDPQFISDLNLKKNGEYDVIIAPPFNGKFKVIVNNQQNYLNLIKEQNERLHDLAKLSENTIFLLNQKEVQIKEIINETSTTKEELATNYNICLENLEENKKNNSFNNIVNKTKLKLDKKITSAFFLVFSFITFLFVKK